MSYKKQRPVKTPRDRIRSSSMILDQVMDQIKSGQVKMRPKSYFIFGSILMASGLAVFFALAAFFFNHFFFHLFNLGLLDFWQMRGLSRLLLEVFPWWSLVLAGVFVMLGAWLIHQYDVAYKKNYKVMVASLVASAVLFGFLLNFLGLNRLFMRQHLMGRLYQVERVGASWLVGRVIKVEPEDQQLVVKVGPRQVRLKYSSRTRLPYREIEEGQLIRAVGRFASKKKDVFEADAVGLGPRHLR